MKSALEQELEQEPDTAESTKNFEKKTKHGAQIKRTNIANTDKNAKNNGQKFRQRRKLLIRRISENHT